MTQWVKPFPSSHLWRLGSLSAIRITEAGVVRVTEDDTFYRVIERDRQDWREPPPPSTTWT